MIYSCLFMHNVQLGTKSYPLGLISYPVSLPATMNININLQLDKVEVNHTAQRWHSVCVQHNQREGCGGVQGHQLLLMNEKELRMFD